MLTSGIDLRPRLERLQASRSACSEITSSRNSRAVDRKTGEESRMELSAIRSAAAIIIPRSWASSPPAAFRNDGDKAAFRWQVRHQGRDSGNQEKSMAFFAKGKIVMTAIAAVDAQIRASLEHRK